MAKCSSFGSQSLSQDSFTNTTFKANLPYQKNLFMIAFNKVGVVKYGYKMLFAII